MALMIIYFPLTSSFFDSLIRLIRDWIGLARVMGASPIRIMWQLSVPAALPGLGSGLRLAEVFTSAGAIIGEWQGKARNFIFPSGNG